MALFAEIEPLRRVPPLTTESSFHLPSSGVIYERPHKSPTELQATQMAIWSGIILTGAEVKKYVEDRLKKENLSSDQHTLYSILRQNPSDGRCEAIETGYPNIDFSTPMNSR